MSVRLIVVRHGQTHCNVANIWHGWDDCELTETGLAQAQAVAERLAGEDIAVVYTSDSRRAHQTGQAIAERHGLAPIPDRRLRERNPGVLEGMPAPEVFARYSDLLSKRDVDPWGWLPPEGETFYMVRDRVLDMVRQVGAEHDGQTVVLATHMGPMRALVSQFAGVSLAETYRMDFPSTGVSIFILDGDRVEVEEINGAAHTADIGV